MAYEVLARRYRSQSFDQVVGQGPIAQTLKNAIKTGRIHHAYLFCGTRGVGKTSMARLFARALNAPATISDCPESADYNDYPEEEVQWRMAEAIMRGDDLNVIEIDGASNRSVDDARQLIADAGLAPSTQARFKIYIIDEVHMLTPQAFNTLLKTMEEPPAHLKFILCTTEPEKVLATIQSRCQRFDFRNIPTVQIKAHLQEVIGKESLEADEAVLAAVARMGNGSMRDALSLLDRLLATGEEKLTLQVLEQMMGLPASELIVKLVDAIAASDVKATLETCHELLQTGTSLEQLLTVFIDYMRNVMLAASCGEASELIEVNEAMREKLGQQASQFRMAALIHMIALCESVYGKLKYSASPRAMLEATFVRLALSEQFADVAALAAQAGSVKKKVGSTAKPQIAATQQGSYNPPAATPTQQYKPQPSSPQPAPAQPSSRPSSSSAPQGGTQAKRSGFEFKLPGHPDNAGSGQGGQDGQGSAQQGRRVIQQRTQRPGPRRITTEQREDALNKPIVRQLMDEFDLSLIDVVEDQKPKGNNEKDDASKDA